MRYVLTCTRSHTRRRKTLQDLSTSTQNQTKPCRFVPPPFCLVSRGRWNPGRLTEKSMGGLLPPPLTSGKAGRSRRGTKKQQLLAVRSPPQSDHSLEAKLSRPLAIARRKAPPPPPDLRRSSRLLREALLLFSLSLSSPPPDLPSAAACCSWPFLLRRAVAESGREEEEEEEREGEVWRGTERRTTTTTCSRWC